MKRSMWLTIVVAFFASCVLGTKACCEWLDAPLVAVEPNRSNWKRCPDRKPVKVNGRNAYWYCGPGEAEATGAVVASVGAGPKEGRAKKRAAGSRGSAARGR